MSDSKPLASLSGALLARKGQAIPAMRRQNMMALNAHPSHGEALEDLGWNDMGLEQQPVARQTGLSPMAPSPVVEIEQAEVVSIEQGPVPVIVQQQRELAAEIEDAFSASVSEEASEENLEVSAPVRTSIVSKAPRSAPGSRGKAAFTLRLDADRHLKLRLVCALQHKSAQQVVTAALDAFLTKQKIPESITNSSSIAAVC